MKKIPTLMDKFLSMEKLLDELEHTPFYSSRDKAMTKEMIKSCPPATTWISVKDRLPENDEVVIACIIGSDFILQEEEETLEDAMARARKHMWITLSYLDDNGWYSFDGYPEIIEPDYWMPLPEPPKEE